MTARAFLFSAAFLLLPLTSAELAAQTVSGTVVEEGSAEPVIGALVILLDEHGTRRTAVLSDDRGAFTMAAPAAGRYQLRVERIGLRSTTSPWMDVASGQVAEQRVVASPEAVRLAALSASARSRCAVRPREGLQASAVWEEARKALTANALTVEQRVFGVEIEHYERELAPGTLRIVKESRWKQSGFTVNPVVSLPADQLAADGYIQKRAGDFWYYGPDARVLLSDTFLDGHCLRVEARHADDRNLIGLAFEPIKGRKLPDVEGTLWLDRESSELRFLEYKYTALPADIPPELPLDKVGGRVEFKRLPSGHWIVERWAIRMPLVVIEQTRFQRQDGRGMEERLRPMLRAIVESGGEVTAVLGRAGAWSRSGVAQLKGSVFDSTRGVPLRGATVFLSGTQHSATSDSAGSFQLDSLPPGSYSVSFAHSRLGSLGAAGSVVDITLERGRSDSVRLTVPAYETIVASLCPDSLRGPGLGVVRGLVRDAERGDPIAQMTMRVSWSRSGGAPGAAHRRELTAETETDRAGYFRICGVPMGQPLALRADPRQRPVELRFSGAPVLTHEMLMSLSRPDRDGRQAPPIVRLTVSEMELTREAAGSVHSQLSGAVRDTSGRPVGGADVRILELDLVAATDATGAFLFQRVPAGRYTVRVSSVLHRGAQATIDVREQSAMHLAVALERAPGLLASAEGTPAEAATYPRAALVHRDIIGFETRRARGNGNFLTREEIDRTAATNMVDVLRRVPGVQVHTVRSTMPGGQTRFVVQVDRGSPGASLPDAVRAPPSTDATGQPVAAAREPSMSRVVCEPTYYLDGVEQQRMESGMDLELRSSDLEAIEVYRRADVPAEFPSRPNECGVVLIWTRAFAAPR